MENIMNLQIDVLTDVPTDNLGDCHNLMDCYLNAALALHESMYDGLKLTKGGGCTREYSNHCFIMSVYLLRHAIELGIKQLITQTKQLPANSHNIKFLWDKLSETREVQINPEVFNILSKYGILED